MNSRSRSRPTSTTQNTLLSDLFTAAAAPVPLQTEDANWRTVQNTSYDVDQTEVIVASNQTFFSYLPSSPPTHTHYGLIYSPLLLLDLCRINNAVMSLSPHPGSHSSSSDKSHSSGWQCSLAIKCDCSSCNCCGRSLNNS